MINCDACLQSKTVILVYKASPVGGFIVGLTVWIHQEEYGSELNLILWLPKDTRSNESMTNVAPCLAQTFCQAFTHARDSSFDDHHWDEVPAPSNWQPLSINGLDRRVPVERGESGGIVRIYV